jgi:hypothetical protein
MRARLLGQALKETEWRALGLNANPWGYRNSLMGSWSIWACLEKVESFPWMKGELDDEAEGIYARV